VSGVRAHAPGPDAGRARASSAAFHRRVDLALADTRLRQALGRTTARLADGRASAMAALPDADEVRDRARRIRAHTIAQLDRYLDQFASEAERRGCQVHWAETAADARRIVTDIARAEGVTLAVKSKSMVSEEIGLNEALEAAGVRVVETDLGEYVVQVAEDRPSHIIAPIVHWRREDVAQLFRDKLGASDDDVRDVASITAFARRTLREQFLAAGMGISGVNMAVAESGSLCLVTNEGNGRLTTSAPRVHVALMGLERVVPTAADLGVILQLLARSATGQALSVYTSIITGPRRRPSANAGAAGVGAAEPDGPDRLHVVIVDNGRGRLLGTNLAEILYCIRCGACLNICPVYRHVGGHAYDSVYPGPIGSVVTPGLSGLESAVELPQASSLCGACRDVCPVRIDLPHLLLELRAESVRRELGPLWLRLAMPLFAAVVTRPRLYRFAARAMARLATLAARDGHLRRLPWPFAGWTASRDFPVPSRRSFVQRWRDTRRGRETRHE
jgi:L-lactate dehydrogenase complex protein LldF